MNQNERELEIGIELVTHIGSKTLSLETIQDYENFIEQNYVVNEGNRYYLSQHIINLALSTFDDEIVSSALSALSVNSSVIEKAQDIVFLKTQGNEKNVEEYLTKRDCGNVFLDWIYWRTIVEMLVNACDYTRLKAVKEKYTVALDSQRETSNHIAWGMRYV